VQPKGGVGLDPSPVARPLDDLTIESILLERSGLMLMLGSLATFLLFFAEAAPVVAKPEVNPLLQYLPLLPIPIVFYFMLIRPQQQQEKKRRELMGQLKKNDKVLTAAGMYGTVISVDEKSGRVQLRLDDDGKVKATFTRASIVQILSDPSEKPTETK
jgi:preprotein translocase subunit YajC